MKRFVVGYLDFFDNDLKMEVVEANNEVEAVKKYLGDDWVFPETAELDDIQNICFNGSICVSVIEV